MDKALMEKLSPVTAEEERLLAGGPLDKTLYTSGGGFIVDPARLLEENKLINVRPHTRFVDFPAHSHNYVEIIYMCAGSTTHLINGKPPLTLNTGEVLMLNQQASHAIKRAEAGDIAVNFLVLPQFFDYALELIGPDNVLGRFLAGSLQKGGGELGYLCFRVGDVLPVQNLMENLIWSIVEKQPNHRRIDQVSMGLLFLQLMNHTQRLETAQNLRGGNALAVAALREVEENYKTASLSQLAAAHRVSVAYLSHTVHKASGRTFKELLQEKRLSKAAFFLVNTGLTVGEVIAAVGYDNQSYFYRLFRRRYGLSPSAFRARRGRLENG